MFTTSSGGSNRGHRLRPRWIQFVVVAAVVVPNLWTGSSAFADTVSNNVTVGGNDTVDVGSTTSVSYRLNATHDSGEPGSSARCNASTSSPVSVTVNVAV